MMKNPLLQGLYAITAGQQGQKLFDDAQAALRGGARLLLYRDKTTDPARRFAEASQLNMLCEAFQVPFLVNDDLPLALAVGAQGVHLGQEDGDAAIARQQVPEGFIIGVTCHDSLTLAKKAEASGADYVSFGTCFASSTKPDAPAASLSAIKDACTQLTVPVSAIGGITLRNVSEVVATGVDMVCVISDLFSADDIELRANQLSRLLLRK